MPRPGLVIRPTREDDWAAVRALRLEMLRDTPIAFGDTLERALEYGEPEWRTRARRGESSEQASIVAIEGDRWVGTMSCYVPDQASGPMLVGVYVAPDRRGDGGGTALLDAVTAHLAGYRLSRTLLATADAHPLYERYGFRPLAHPIRFMER